MNIVGNIFHFDWLDPTKVTVVWAINGSGKYNLPSAGGFGDKVSLVNIPVDIYLNEWAQIYLLRVEVTRCSPAKYQPIKTGLFV